MIGCSQWIKITMGCYRIGWCNVPKKENFKCSYYPSSDGGNTDRAVDGRRMADGKPTFEGWIRYFSTNVVIK
ncbi:hypothetical protein [Candidatus Hodgkinia cicadicola]|uniref:hypothetical protein n=1 Tax=Candidatus Hodgkinia cicadicola TaxID=573658 RepID=UPI0011BA4C5A